MNEYSGMPEKEAALSALNNLSASLNEIGSPEWEVSEATALVSRFKEAVSDVHGRLSWVSTSFVTVDWLQNIEGTVEDLTNLVQSLKDSSPSLHEDLRSAHSRIDQLLHVAAFLPAIPLQTADQAVETVLKQFHSEVASEKEAIAQRSAETLSNIANLRQEQERRNTELQEHTSNVRQEIDDQVSKALNSLSGLEIRTNDAVERLERDISNNQELFRQAQENREQAFSAAQGQRDQDFHNRLNATLEELEGFRDQAREMLAEVGGAGSAQHYAKQRDAQKNNADHWRKIGLGAFVLLILVAMGVFIEAAIANREFSVVWLAARSGLLAAVLLFVTYALRQSGQHRRREEEIDRVANELTLLWPFMSRLPDEDRKELMLGITPLYFKGGLPMRDPTEHASWLESIRNAVGQRRGRSADD